MDTAERPGILLFVSSQRLSFAGCRRMQPPPHPSLHNWIDEREKTTLKKETDKKPFPSPVRNRFHLFSVASLVFFVPFPDRTNPTFEDMHHDAGVKK